MVAFSDGLFVIACGIPEVGLSPVNCDDQRFTLQA